MSEKSKIARKRKRAQVELSFDESLLECLETKIKTSNIVTVQKRDKKHLEKENSPFLINENVKGDLLRPERLGKFSLKF